MTVSLMGLKRITFLLVAFLLLSACSRSAGDATVESLPADMGVTESAPTLSPSPTATVPPTSTPEPTPIVPSISVAAQILNEDGLLTFDEVIIPEGGWLAIYQVVDGEPGDLLGYERLVPGANGEVTIEIEPREATTSLMAQLHVDAGESGVFEYPDEDIPLNEDGDPVTETFDVDIQLPIAAVDVADQALSYDGFVTVNNVFALVPGWLVIHNYENNVVGEALGQVPVQPGQNNDLSFTIRWRDANPSLIAILYEDSEQPGGFDETVDLPVLEDEEAVIAEFSVTLPPDVLIYDQPVIDSKLIVERATSDKPAWIVAYQDQEDLPGLIIGSAFIEAGVNELVELEILELSATQRLFLMIHEDTATPGEFDFPAADLPVIQDGQPLPPFIMDTMPGNYLITKDQQPGNENQVIVPLVVADLDTWVVIYNVNEIGRAADVVGQTWLPAGINRDIVVAVDSEQVTQTLIAMLHIDRIPIESFDFPDGDDTPLVRNLLPIQSPFQLNRGADENRPLP